MKNFKNSYFPFLLLFIQPVFMASNLIVARGGVESVPPISLAFWRWAVVVLLLLPFTYSLLIKNSKIIKKEFQKLFFLGTCLLYTSPSPRDGLLSRMPSSA